MFRIVLTTLLLAFVVAPNFCSAQSQEFNDLPLEQLEKQLNAILKTRLPEERLFIAAVVKLVKDEKLPRRFVNSSFKYVINRRPFTKYRFVYFVRVLHFLGKRESVSVPSFDFNIYSTPARQRAPTS